MLSHIRPRATLATIALRRWGSTTAQEKRILVTGSSGQVGAELVPMLRQAYGEANVVASDIRKPEKRSAGPFVYCDVLDYDSLARVVVEEKIDYLIHLGAVLSAVGERNPALALKVNVRGSENVLEIARQTNLRVLIPSTIAAFGPTTPRVNTPDLTIMRPTTMYGVNKVYVELLGEYYRHKFGVDFRSLRYPGVISAETLPGGGTTDYAVEIFYEALKHGRYTSFLGPNARLPMMYMPDTLKATVALLEAPRESLKQCVYNVAAISFTPSELAAAIKRHLPHFECDYKPDFRQAIAESWPESLDDTNAREHWGWAPDFDLDAMTADMLVKLRAKLAL